MDSANALVSCRITVIIALLWLVAAAGAIQPHSSDWATTGFFFDWNSPSTILPTPITAQCETLNIHWNRGAGTGPDPIPPYFLRVYSSAINSSTDSFQLLLAGNTASTQLRIPFPPGTLYTICMTDSVGISGGCQDLYTVYPPTTAQTCRGFTPPARVLGMKGISSATQSTFSRWGWPASCTDLELEPIDDASTGGIKGTPPYTLTVVPAFRPPLNITFEQSVKWTITLDRSTPFFLSVSDANGVTWTDGPLHAGEGDTSCLSQAISAEPGVSVPATLGAAVGAFVLGGILAATVFWLLARRRRNEPPFYRADEPHLAPSNNKPRREANGSIEPLHIHSHPALNDPADGHTRKRPINYGPLGSYDSTNPARRRTQDNLPEPSIPLRNALRHSSSSRVSVSSLNVSPSMNRPPPSAISSASNPPGPGGMPLHEVFVVHHDAGAPPPVTVYALPGSRVTELPPDYTFGDGPPRSPAEESPTQEQFTLPSERPPALSLSTSTSTSFRRDQKASFTPRSAHTTPSTTFTPLGRTPSVPDLPPSTSRRGPLPMGPPQ